MEQDYNQLTAELCRNTHCMLSLNDFKVDLENPHVIDKHQVWIGTVGKGPDSTTLTSSYENRFRNDYQASLGNAIVNFARVVPQGLLLFFPSYPVMEICLDNWQRNNIWNRIEQYKPIFVEPKNKFEFQTAMLNFYEKIQDPTLNGAIFAAVCRGKVSEGLDFSDNNGRAVVITGLPFPPRMDPKVVLKMQFLDDLRRHGGKGLTGQEWYRQQASRAVNQAIGRVIRHRQDFGAIILCDNRFESATAKNQLPSWVRPNVGVYDKFGIALREIMMFFKTAQKLLPAPTLTKSCSKASAPGCQGAFFPPTVTRTGFSGPVERASSVASHVPSLKDRNSSSVPDEMSLAKLKVQYETAVPSTSTSKSKGLLAALVNTEGSSKEETESLSNTQVPSYQKALKLDSQSSQKSKKKIIIKGSKSMASGVNKDNLQSAELYLAEVKETLSSQSYGYFTKALTGYKKTGDYTTMVTCLAEIFTDNPKNYHLFRKFYRFVRHQHKADFHQTCQDIIGQGCGYKPEDSLPKKRSTSNGGNNGCEKKRKLEDKLPSSGTGFDSKSTTKNQPLLSGSTKQHLDAKTHLNHGGGLILGAPTGLIDVSNNVVSGQSSHNTDCITDKQRPNLFEAMLNPQGVKKPCSNKDRNVSSTETNVKASETKPVLQPSSSNINSKTLSLSNENKNLTESQGSQGSLGSDDLFKENSDSNGSSPNGNNKNTCRSNVSSGGAESKRNCKPFVTETTKEDLKAYIFTHRGSSGYKCCHCKDDAIVPLKAPCEHVCCIECWKECIRDLKQCPACGLKVKRKHLSRLFFNSGTDAAESEPQPRQVPPPRQT